MKKYLSGFLTIMVLAVLCVAAEPKTDEPASKWRKVLAFDVLDREKDHKADIGNHRIVIASWQDGLCWDIGIFDYPVKAYSMHSNLLSREHNWHGIQDWMVYSDFVNTNRDERIVPYDKGKSEVKIAVVECQLEQVGSNSYEFVKGRIEVFHKP